ncbi:hypothetical protein BKA65DRAFT_30152 [Rhexocercosporidium sp. MPI-PUGE-AT-0058]|nr:hypothetical protein BKA65DRAFT_30152 [Rhexocercosporidium sp. MPI-PUGE-AT-0058]
MVLIEVQSVGKNNTLCSSDSGFVATYQSCLSCLDAFGEGSFISKYIAKFYRDSVAFCDEQMPLPVANPSLTASTSLSTPSSSSTCSPYPTATKPLANVSPTNATTRSAPSNGTQTNSYPFGFWLEYTFVPCPTRTANPTFTYPAECIPLNYTWGCPPGYLCTPPQVDCDLEIGPPSNEYLCSPDDCKVPPYFTGFPILNTTTNSTIYSPLPLPTGYFNLNPVIFGADWGVFTGDVSITSTTGPVTSTSTSATPTPTPSPSALPAKQISNRKWIAGPVIGGIAAVGILALTALYLLKRQRRRKILSEEGTHEKAQLDGTEVKPKEAGGNEIKEIYGRNVQPVEMDAGYAGVEMETARSNDDGTPVQEIGQRERLQ